MYWAWLFLIYSQAGTKSIKNLPLLCGKIKISAIKRKGARDMEKDKKDFWNSWWMYRICLNYGKKQMDY